MMSSLNCNFGVDFIINKTIIQQMFCCKPILYILPEFCLWPVLPLSVASRRQELDGSLLNIIGNDGFGLVLGSAWHWTGFPGLFPVISQRTGTELSALNYCPLKTGHGSIKSWISHILPNFLILIDTLLNTCFNSKQKQR